MVKYLLFILVILLSGCTADFSGSLELEESVYIRFSSYADVKADVEEAFYGRERITRSGYTTPGNSVGILGIATHEDVMGETTLVGHDAGSLREWMQNDVYSRNPADGTIVHADNQYPTFPIDKGSAIAAYAYMPHTDRVVYEADDCYIPLDLMADSATTDWAYTGHTAMSKAMYREKGTFALGVFKHAMTRLEVVVDTPSMDKFNRFVRIIEMDLGVHNHGKGRLSLVDGKITMDTASYTPDSVYHLLRKPDYDFAWNNPTLSYTETFYLMPYTKIHNLSVVALWNNTDTIRYEYVIADSTQWNTANLRPGAVSRLKLKTVKNTTNNNENTHL